MLPLPGLSQLIRTKLLNATSLTVDIANQIWVRAPRMPLYYALDLQSQNKTALKACLQLDPVMFKNLSMQLNRARLWLPVDDLLLAPSSVEIFEPSKDVFRLGVDKSVIDEIVPSNVYVSPCLNGDATHCLRLETLCHLDNGAVIKSSLQFEAHFNLTEGSLTSFSD